MGDHLNLYVFFNLLVVLCVVETFAFVAFNRQILVRRFPYRRWTKDAQKNGGSFTMRAQIAENGVHQKTRKVTRKSYELNKIIIKSENSIEIIQAIADQEGALTSTAGGMLVDGINFSTSIHRIGRHAASSRKDRKNVLTDPRFPLFLCSLAEKLAGLRPSMSLSQLIHALPDELEKHCYSTTSDCSIRELSNIVWGLAKLGIVPPKKTVPISRNLKEATNNMIQTSLKLRREVVESVSNKRRSWISSLSLLMAYVADTISFLCIEMCASTTPKDQELNTLMWSFASMDRAHQPLFDMTSKELAARLGRDSRPQHYSNTLWAFAKSKISPTHQIDIIQKTAEILEESTSFRAKWKPVEFANTAWALANIILQRRYKNGGRCKEQDDKEDSLVVRIMRIVARDVVQRCDSYKPQEISNLFWAMGSIGFGYQGSGTSNVNEYVFVETDDWKQDKALVKEVASAISTCTKRLHLFSSQELNNLAYGFARLQFSNHPSLFAAIGKELGNPHRKLTGRDISITLWSFATIGFFDRNTFETVLSSMPRAQAWNPQAYSNVAWAIGTAQLELRDYKTFDTSFFSAEAKGDIAKLDDPLATAIQTIGQEIIARGDSFKPQELKDTLWGLSKSMTRYPTVFRAVAEQMVGKATPRPQEGKWHRGRGFESFTSREIANFVWAYAKQAALASQSKISELGDGGGTGRMIVYSSIHLDVGENLLRKLFNAALTAQLNHGSALSPTDMANTMWSLATLGYHHGPFLYMLEKELIKRMTSYIRGNRHHHNSFESRELTNLVRGFATFNKLTPDLLNLVAPYIASALEANYDHQWGQSDAIDARIVAKWSERQQLANLAWSCAVANHFPPDLMRFVYSCVVGKNAEDAAYLAKAFGDEGLSEQPISSMLYAQSLIDLEDIDVEVSLPPEFPVGWVAEGGEDFDRSDVAVTVSKIQQSVMDVCDLVGLRGQAEYKIQLREKMSLSLDIAFPEQMVCIEVEGPTHFYYDLDEWDPLDEPNSKGYFSKGKFDFPFCSDHGRDVKINGSTTLRNNILSNLGWRVLSIPFFDWRRMVGNQEKQKEFIEDLLISHNVKIP